MANWNKLIATAIESIGGKPIVSGGSGPVKGDMLYFDGTNWVDLAIGTTNQIIQPSGGIPAWVSTWNLGANSLITSNWTVSESSNILYFVFSPASSAVARIKGQNAQIVLEDTISNSVKVIQDFSNKLRILNSAQNAVLWEITDAGITDVDLLFPQGLATSATSGGFLRLPTTAGVPTGIPTNGSGSTIYDSTDNRLYVYNSGWQQILAGSQGLSEVAFLQTKSDAGKLTIARGTTATNAVAASITPANGTTFVLYQAKAIVAASSTNAPLVQLRNNAVVKDDATNSLQTNAGEATIVVPFIVKGDTLAGDGVKTYDVNVTNNAGGNTVYASLEGYLE